MRRAAASWLVLAAVAGCGLSPDRGPRVLDAGDVPRGAERTPAPATSGSARLLVYLSRNGVLVAVSRAVSDSHDPSLALRALAAGPSRREQDAGLVSAVAPAAFGLAVDLVAGVAVVDNPAPDASSSGRTDEVLAYAQVVLTLTSLNEVRGVQFVRGGKPLAVPRSDGTLSAGPLTRRDYLDLI